MAGTSVVYPLIVQILTLKVSLLIYLVSVYYTHYIAIISFTIGWAQIEDIIVDLPKDVTVLPQTFTLHAIKYGSNDHNTHLHSVTWYYESSTELCSGVQSSYSCTIGDGEAVDYGNGRWDYTVNVTWKEENIESQSNKDGDHVFKFYLNFGEVERDRTITITGK